jgi:hypothetical protein
MQKTVTYNADQLRPIPCEKISRWLPDAYRIVQHFETNRAALSLIAQHLAESRKRRPNVTISWTDCMSRNACAISSEAKHIGGRTRTSFAEKKGQRRSRSASHCCRRSYRYSSIGSDVVAGRTSRASNVANTKKTNGSRAWWFTDTHVKPATPPSFCGTSCASHPRDCGRAPAASARQQIPSRFRQACACGCRFSSSQASGVPGSLHPSGVATPTIVAFSPIRKTTRPVTWGSA